MVIDCGINVEENGEGKRKLYGDVDFEAAREVGELIRIIVKRILVRFNSSFNHFSLFRLPALSLPCPGASAQ